MRALREARDRRAGRHWRQDASADVRTVYLGTSEFAADVLRAPGRARRTARCWS